MHSGLGCGSWSKVRSDFPPCVRLDPSPEPDMQVSICPNLEAGDLLLLHMPIIHKTQAKLTLPPPRPHPHDPLYRYMAAPTEFGKQRNRAEADVMGVAFAELGPEAYAKWEFEKGFWNSGDDLEGDVRARWGLKGK